MADAFIRRLSSLGIFARQYAFADELKKEIDPLFLLNAGISAFTEDPVEKERVRRVLISYGTGYWRDKDPDHWIKRLAENLKKQPNPHIAIITDARFASNEIPWIKNNGGKIIHLSRINEDGTGFPPAGEDEAYNDPLIKEIADHKISWKNYKNNLHDCYYSAIHCFNQIFPPEQISQWQNDFPIPTQN